MEKEEGILNRKSSVNISIIKTIMLVHQGINVNSIDFCDPHDQEKRKNFCINKLRNLYPEGLNYNQINN